jgi:hypothetical protein
MSETNSLNPPDHTTDEARPTYRGPAFSPGAPARADLLPIFIPASARLFPGTEPAQPAYFRPGRCRRLPQGVSGSNALGRFGQVGQPNRPSDRPLFAALPVGWPPLAAVGYNRGVPAWVRRMRGGLAGGRPGSGRPGVPAAVTVFRPIKR